MSNNSIEELTARLQKYVKFLNEKIGNSMSDRPHHLIVHHLMAVVVHQIITDTRKRHKYETLLKCEAIILKMMQAQKETTPNNETPTIRSPDPPDDQVGRYVSEMPKINSKAAESVAKLKRYKSILPELGTSKSPMSLSEHELPPPKIKPRSKDKTEDDKTNLNSKTEVIPNFKISKELKQPKKFSILSDIEVTSSIKSKDLKVSKVKDKEDNINSRDEDPDEKRMLREKNLVDLSKGVDKDNLVAIVKNLKGKSNQDTMIIRLMQNLVDIVDVETLETSTSQEGSNSVNENNDVPSSSKIGERIKITKSMKLNPSSAHKKPQGIEETLEDDKLKKYPLVILERLTDFDRPYRKCEETLEDDKLKKYPLVILERLTDFDRPYRKCEVKEKNLKRKVLPRICKLAGCNTEEDDVPFKIVKKKKLTMMKNEEGSMRENVVLVKAVKDKNEKDFECVAPTNNNNKFNETAEDENINVVDVPGVLNRKHPKDEKNLTDQTRSNITKNIENKSAKNKVGRNNVGFKTLKGIPNNTSESLNLNTPMEILKETNESSKELNKASKENETPGQAPTKQTPLINSYPVHNIVSRLQEQTNEKSTPKVEVLDNGNRLYRVGSIDAQVSPSGLTTYYCRRPDCIFNTVDKNIFEAHCKFTHKYVFLLLTCQVCAEERTEKQEMIENLSHIYKHIEEGLCKEAQDSSSMKDPETNSNQALSNTKKVKEATYELVRITEDKVDIPRKHPVILKKWLSYPIILQRLLKCPVYYCEFTTDSEEYFDAHLKYHDSNALVSCMYCNFQMKPEFIKLHYMMRHSNCFYGCPYCLYRSISFDYIRIHQESKHKFKPIKTLNLKREYFSTLFREPNLPFIKNIMKPYICSCQKKFYAITNFETHLSICRKGTYKCSLCKEMFLKPERLIQHFEMHQIFTYNCRYCEFGDQTPELVRNHIAAEHSFQKANIVWRVLTKNEYSVKDSNEEEDSVFDNFIIIPFSNGNEDEGLNTPSTSGIKSEIIVIDDDD